MLVLSRKPEQTIHIGDEITIKVIRLRGQNVSIGIEAPRDFRILRGEHYEANAAEQQGEETNAVPRSDTDAGGNL